MFFDIQGATKKA